MDSALANTLSNTYVTIFFFLSVTTFVNLSQFLHDTVINIFFILTKEKNGQVGCKWNKRVMINTLEIKIEGVIQQWERQSTYTLGLIFLYTCEHWCLKVERLNSCGENVLLPQQLYFQAFLIIIRLCMRIFLSVGRQKKKSRFTSEC